MKKEFVPSYPRLPDGSFIFGNGVIGPSTRDVLYFNSLQGGLKIPTLLLPLTGAGLTGFALACSGGGEKNAQELENKESSGYALPFPKGETWFLTGGPHADGLSNGVRYAIDIAPPEGGKCPTDGSRLVINNRIVTASASGQVIVANDDKNRSDPSHSMIKVKDAKGLTEVYIHLDKTKVKKGDKVKQGTPLGNPSCEYPPGGRNEGAHVHVGLEKDGQPIPIDGVIVGEWTIHNGPRSYDGTMTKNGEKTRTADVRRCDTDTKCGGIRNDLPNNPPSKALVGGPKDPIPPISGSVNEKSVETIKEKWKTFKSPVLPYEVQYPASWNTNSGVARELYDNFKDKDRDFSLTVAVSSIDPNTTLDNYVNTYIQSYRQNWKEFHPDQPDLINFITVKKRKTASINSQTVQIDRPPTPERPASKSTPYTPASDGSSLTSTLFIEPRSDGSQWIWIILYSHSPTVSKADGESVLMRFLDSFRLVQNSSSENQPEVGWKRVKSFDLPYQIDYPSNWQQVGNEFYGETTKANPIKFEVASEPVASWITIDDYKNRYAQAVKDTVKLFGGNVQITEKPNQSINGQKAWRLDGFVTSPSVTPNRSVTYITIKDGKVWVLVYAADSSEFNQNIPTFQKMLDSFKFLQ